MTETKDSRSAAPERTYPAAPINAFFGPTLDIAEGVLTDERGEGGGRGDRLFVRGALPRREAAGHLEDAAGRGL